jgi:hypothetical protein
MSQTVTYYIVAYLLKARTMQQEKTSVARERLWKHPLNEEAHQNRGTMEMTFCTQSLPRAYKGTLEQSNTKNNHAGKCQQ